MPSWGVRLELLDKFAAHHHGLVTRAAAASLGVSRSSWYRAIEAGRFELLYPNVARLWGTPSTFYQESLAAVWAVGPDALSSHRTSAALWGVERPVEDPIDVILPSRRRHSLPEGIVVHRPRDGVDLRPVMRNGVPTTMPARMLLDLGAVDEAAVGPALISIIASKVISPAAVHGALVRHSKQGRHGVVALRRALEELLHDDIPVDSDLEARMARLLRDYHLPPAQFHAIVEGFEADFLVIGTRVILECDGWGSHGLDRDQFEFDRFRDATLLSAGYITVRFTWRQVVGQPQTVAARIERVLRLWHPELFTSTSGSG